MISRRNFINIAVMMAVLFFLFSFSMVIRDRNRGYDSNEHLSENNGDSSMAWQQDVVSWEDAQQSDASYVVYVGTADSDMEQSVSWWCNYTKQNMVQVSDLAECPSTEEKQPIMIILQSEQLAEGTCLARLQEYADLGVTIVFGSLQDPEQIQERTDLKQFLGIEEVRAVRTTITGVKLFDGFLLGGEAVYKAENESEQERQDFELEVPWYVTGGGTKTYMTGLMDQNEMDRLGIKNEELPALIWRNGTRAGNVFAVCGDYMSDSTALGILDGMMTESQSYVLYPIVNAQNFFVANFFGFVSENDAEIQKRYSRSSIRLEQDIIWPALISIAEQNERKMTCFFALRSNYTEGSSFLPKMLTFYQKQFKEQGAEAGISLQYRNAESVQKKLECDAADLSSDIYQYRAYYGDKNQILDVLRSDAADVTGEADTFVCSYDRAIAPVSYCADTRTLQNVTSDGVSHTYREDLRMRSIESALGYTNVMVDLQKILWPENETDQWEKVQEKFAGNLATYWKPYRAFTATTASESDGRIRTFLNLRYAQREVKDGILLQISEPQSWFLLRVSGKRITDVSGGSWQELEEGVYLIQAESSAVKIVLKSSSLHYTSDESITR